MHNAMRTNYVGKAMNATLGTVTCPPPYLIDVREGGLPVLDLQNDITAKKCYTSVHKVTTF